MFGHEVRVCSESVACAFDSDDDGVLERLFAVLREHQVVGEDADCFGLDSTSVKVHPDGTGARKTNGMKSIGKSRGGWNTKIRMVAASDRPAMVFPLSGGHAHDAPELRN